MRKLLTLGAVFALAASVSGPAQAGPSAVDGTLEVILGTLGGPALTGSSPDGVSDGPFDLAEVPAGLLNLTEDVTVLISPPAIGLSKITLMAPIMNDAGSFDPGGAMGNNGVSNLFFTNNSAAGSVALKYVGGGGTGMGLVAGLPITVVGATWTNLGVVTATPTKMTVLMEAPAGIKLTLTATAFDKRTAKGAGELQLIAPAIAKINKGDLGNLPVIGQLTLNYAPEPGFILLFGAGALTLALVGRRSRRG